MSAKRESLFARLGIPENYRVRSISGSGQRPAVGRKGHRPERPVGFVKVVGLTAQRGLPLSNSPAEVGRQYVVVCGKCNPHGAPCGATQIAATDEMGLRGDPCRL